MNTNNSNSTESQSQLMVPLLVPGTKKKGPSKKPRVRPKKKSPLVASKRKANKIGTIARSTTDSTGNKAQRVDFNGDAATVISERDQINARIRDNGQSDRDAVMPQDDNQNKNSSPMIINRPQRRINTGRSSSPQSISIGSSIQTSNQRQLVTQSQSTQQSSLSSSNNEPSRTSDDTVASLTDSSTPTTIKNYTIDEREIIPYQHLGQLDPEWNIPTAQDNEKTMKDFCSKFKAPRETKKKGRKKSKGENDNDNGSASNSTNTNQTSASSQNTGSETQAQTEPQSDQRSGPLVEVINGEIVIKESTMIVGQRKTTEEVDREFNNAVVEEDNTTLTVTYRSFTTREKSIRWTVEETRKFFLALRQCGTDFTTMENFFDGSDGERKRSRKQLKNKYNIECRKNLNLIDMAMNPKAQLKLDVSVFGELDMENANVTTSTTTSTRATANETDGEEKDETSVNVVTDALSTSSTMNYGAQSTTLLNTITPSTLDTPDIQETDPSAADDLIPVVNGEPQKVNKENEKDYTSSATALHDVEIQEERASEELNQSSNCVESAVEKVQEKIGNIPIALPGAGKKKKKPKFRAKPKPRKKK